jgi:hypothetical protein
MKTLGFVAAMGFLAGCGSQADGELVAVEHNSLGIAQVEIDHDMIKGERVMTARGIDQDGEQIATATLRTGMVLYGADVEPAWNEGTELTIAIGDESRVYTTPDRLPHEETLPYQTDLATFVRLKAVSTAIDDEAGIRFAEPSISDEVAFAAENCSGAHFPTDKGSPSQCCRDGVNLYFKIASGSNLNKLGWRQMHSSLQACRASDGSSSCSDAACTYGPCYNKVNSVSGTNTTAAAVFTPSNTALCGTDGDGTGSSGADLTGAGAYTGSQALKPGVTATCTYTNCITGIPGNKLTVLSTASTSTTVGVTVGGYPSNINDSGEAWFASTTDIRVTGYTPNEYTTISGAGCNKISTWGKPVACVIPAGSLTGDAVVEVGL